MNKNIETVTKLRTGDEVIVIAGKDMGKKELSKKFLNLITKQSLQA